MDEYSKSGGGGASTGGGLEWGPGLAVALLGLLAGLALGAVGLPEGVSTDPGAAAAGFEPTPQSMEQALREPDALRRAVRVAAILERLDEPAATANGEPLGALRQVFAGAAIPDGDVEFALFGAWWARFDPTSALGWARSEPQAASISVLAAVLEEWGRQDPFAAVRSARLESIEVRRLAAVAAVLRGAASRSSGDDRLGDVVGEIEDRVERRAAARAAAAMRLRRTDGSKVLEWARAMPTAQSEAHADFVAGAAMAVARVDPERAIEALVPRVEAGDTSMPPVDVVGAIAAVWSEQEPAATIEWLASLAPGVTVSDALSRVIREAYQRWIVQDRQAALAWAAERDAVTDPWFDPIRATAGLIVGQEDPEEGLRMLSKLPIARERALKVRHVFTKWKQDAPEAAERWLLEADLPEERKQELRNAPVEVHPLQRPKRS